MGFARLNALICNEKDGVVKISDNVTYRYLIVHIAMQFTLVLLC